MTPGHMWNMFLSTFAIVFIELCQNVHRCQQTFDPTEPLSDAIFSFFFFFFFHSEHFRKYSRECNQQHHSAE